MDSFLWNHCNECRKYIKDKTAIKCPFCSSEDTAYGFYKKISKKTEAESIATNER